MQPRAFLQTLAATATIPAARIALANPRPRAHRNVQVRVFRRPNHYTWTFLPSVLVQLCNGMPGTTSNRPGVRGTFHFPRLPRQRYTARALVNATAFQVDRPSPASFQVGVGVAPAIDV
jgi:hypothetical protein